MSCWKYRALQWNLMAMMSDVGYVNNFHKKTMLSKTFLYISCTDHVKLLSWFQRMIHLAITLVLPWNSHLLQYAAFLTLDTVWPTTLK